ncbi:MAG: hypothetical protein M1586_00695 [Patescibacteria group bacterium]|nr:hypothetical protein [Patescibacteria group bacterium]MCL5261803.1 hypothetical protein [Patescibacteria group bacterium]
MKNFWGIIVILVVLVGMSYFYNLLSRQSVAIPEGEPSLQAGNANEGLSAAENSAAKNVDLESLDGLEAELNPLEKLQENL